MALSIQTYPLAELPGISAAEVTQLQQVQLHTTHDLLQLARSPQAIQKLAQKMQLPQRYVQKWVALADLSRLPSVNTNFCGLLLHCGVVSTAQLATLAAGTLHSRVRKLHTMTMRRVDLCPSPDQVVQWIREAKLMA